MLTPHAIEVDRFGIVQVARTFTPALPNHMDCAMFLAVRYANIGAEAALTARIRAAAQLMGADRFVSEHDEETRPYERVAS